MIKNLPADEGDTDLIPEPRSSSGEGNGNLPQYSSLETPIDTGVRRATVHGPQSRT